MAAPRRPERDFVNNMAEKIVRVGMACNRGCFVVPFLRTTKVRGRVVASQAASQFGWPSVANGLACTSCTQQSVFSSPEMNRQLGDMLKCSRIAKKLVSVATATVERRRPGMCFLSMFETNAQ